MAVYSMTGFAHCQVQTLLGFLNIEIKAVNSRFLEITCRLPDELNAWEGDIRTLITSNVKRGKVDCRLSWVGDVKVSKTLDQEALKSLLKLQKDVLALQPSAVPLTVESILNYPGLLKPQAIDAELLKSEMMNGLSEALVIFNASREREGAALTTVITGYCDQIQEIVETLRPKLPLMLDNLQTKLEQRLSESLEKILSSKSELTSEEVRDRIRQEVLLYAIKMDVDEEMNRLLTHVAEVKRVLVLGNEVGKKLDFMMQELNREANTLGSKAVAIDMTQTSLKLKVLIEKMREQVQNLQ